MITTTFFLPVLIATLAGSILGGLWYSHILFKKPWMRGVGKTDADLIARKTEQSRVMFYTFFIVFATSFGLATMLTLLNINTVLGAVQVALLISFSFIVTTRFFDLLYVSREPHWSKVPQQLFLVDAGYSICSLSVMSVILVLLR